MHKRRPPKKIYVSQICKFICTYICLFYQIIEDGIFLLLGFVEYEWRHFWGQKKIGKEIEFGINPKKAREEIIENQYFGSFFLKRPL